MTTWPRTPLRPEDYAAIDGVHWRAVAKKVAIAVAEGWNAGLDTKSMADAMGVTPGTYRVLLGKLTQIGVQLRPARAKAKSLGGQVEQQIATLVVTRPDPPVASPAMRRLAQFDPVVKRALERLEGGA